MRRMKGFKHYRVQCRCGFVETVVSPEPKLFEVGDEGYVWCDRCRKGELAIIIGGDAIVKVVFT